MMNRNNENRTVTIARQVIAAIAALFLLSLFLSVRGAVAEDSSAFDMDNWNGESVILEDPQYFMGVEDDDIPVISSVGKTNVKIRGVQSKYKLVNYTIPEQLLRADPDFLALMVEAEKYIGENQFAPGSMLPKVQAAIAFAQSGGRAIIADLHNAALALEGKSGTAIHK